MKSKINTKYINILVLCAVIYLGNSCKNQENEEREIRRILTKQILNRFNQKTKKVALEKEDENYIATIKLQNGRNMQVLFMGNLEKYQIIETLNSELARKISNILNVNCISMSVKEIDSLTSEGTGKLETGEEIKVFYDKKRGWFPMNAESLGIVTKYQLTENTGIKCNQITLTAVDSGMYNGSAFLETGDTLAIMVNQKKGWFPVDELDNLLKLTRLQVEARSQQKVEEIKGKVIEEGLYQATIYSKTGDQVKLELVHNGTNFKWKVIK